MVLTRGEPQDQQPLIVDEGGFEIEGAGVAQTRHLAGDRNQKGGETLVRQPRGTTREGPQTQIAADHPQERATAHQEHQVAAARTTGAGRNKPATAAAPRSPDGSRGEHEGEKEWFGLTEPKGLNRTQ
jgi:hypothetical protein